MIANGYRQLINKYILIYYIYFYLDVIIGEIT